MGEPDAIDVASQALLDAAGPGGEFGRFVRHPVTGETGLVVAVRGDAVQDILAAVRHRKPTLFERLARSFTTRTDGD
jgi:hypothetical protein